MLDQLQKAGGNLAGSIHRGLLTGLLLVVATQLPVFSQAEGGKDSTPGPQEETSSPKPSYDLVGWGQLKPVKGNEGFYDFSCTAREKGRWKKQKVFVKLSDGLKVLADRRVKLTEFKKDDKAYVLGKNREDTSVNPMGLSFTDYRIIGVQAVLKGSGIKVNKDYRDRRDKAVRWLDTQVETSDGQLKVTFFEQKGYRVEADKRTLLINRAPAEAELITSNSRGIYAFVLGKKSEEHPDTGKKSDKKKSVFSTNRVIILDLTALKLGLYQKLYN